MTINEIIIASFVVMVVLLALTMLLVWATGGIQTPGYLQPPPQKDKDRPKPTKPGTWTKF
jgi:hypothetical protein